MRQPQNWEIRGITKTTVQEKTVRRGSEIVEMKENWEEYTCKA